MDGGVVIEGVGTPRALRLADALILRGRTECSVVEFGMTHGVSLWFRGSFPNEDASILSGACIGRNDVGAATAGSNANSGDSDGELDVMILPSGQTSFKFSTGCFSSSTHPAGKYIKTRIRWTSRRRQ